MNTVARWWVLMLLITLFVAVTLVYGAPLGFIISGPLTATEQEAQEGYFNVGREFTLITKPGSTIHDDLKLMLDRDVVVVVEAK